MTREIGVRPVQLGLVLVRLRHATLQVVRHRDLAHTFEEFESVHVAGDPDRQFLGEDRLDEGQVAGAQHRDEELRDLHLSGHRVDDLKAIAAEVYEALLPGDVRLPHRHPEVPGPQLVQLTEAAVLVPGRLRLAVLLPE